MAVIDSLVEDVLKESGVKKGSPTYDAERAVVMRLLEDHSFRRSYARGVGSGYRSLTPAEAWALEVGEVRTPVSGNQAVFKPSDIPNEKDRLEEYRAVWANIKAEKGASGYNYPAGPNGRVGASYVTASRSDTKSPLSDILMKGR